ncbi:MAG TPA: serine hydrolase domain-containing protein [Candidatus Saccharimonadia bacterium]|nr:serine hydrolase domain-containing protein [Candidatus Saccharimonadia bacterium]
MNDRIIGIMQQAIADRVFPGAVVSYVRGGQTTVLPVGHLRYDGAEAVTAETVYDVASITKSIPTSTLALCLIDEGRLGLDDRVIKYVPELQNEYRDQLLVRHLLTYTAVWDVPGGLSAVARSGAEAVRQALLTAPLLAPPGQRYFYTNPPAILLGWIIERICGRPLDEVAAERFFGPLEMAHTTFRPETLPGAVIAPTEIDDRGEVCGQVHDEAAWALRQAGQVAGNAGLFSTAPDLLRFAEMLLAGGRLDGRRCLSAETVARIPVNQVAELGACAGLGWELGQPAFMGARGSDRLFGKTGFTGCFILIDPVKQAALVLLSNRIHPQRPPNREAINAVRRAIADLVFG